jgi:DNA-binding NtrC family response regulator
MERADGRVSRTWSLVSDRPEASRSRAYVLVIDGHACRAFELPAVGELSIGRDDDADVVIDDRAVSRCHARLIAARGEVAIADLGSHNGTRVNGVRVDGARTLASGDEIAIGDVTLVVHLPRRPVVASHGADGRSGEDAGTRIMLGDREVIVADPAMVRIYELLTRVGRADLTVLLCGETGVGKENAAYAVHHHSPRRAGPFISINCAAIQETLAESELFGHEKGAFSGAAGAKPGLLEAAAGGTVFLDEVGELPLGVQAKLLRAVEARRVTRVGSLRERELDVRIVAATNRDLGAEVRAGRFRRDLLYRLNVATIVLPPLRERPREIAILARVFLDDACRRAVRPPLAIAPAAMHALEAHAWPGNVRELRNTMDLIAATVEAGVVQRADLALAAALAGSGESAPDDDLPASGFRPIRDEIDQLEARRIAEALTATGGVHKRAAELIGMPLRTFTTKLKLYGLGARGAKR